MKFLCIGEPLAEFTNPANAPSQFNRNAGGDTLNTAIYLARLSAAQSVGYLSRLGDDAMSLFIRDYIAAEGLIDLSPTEAGGRLGLSFISTDATGERSFTYWRDQAPARRLFQTAEEIALLDQSDVLFLSGITLAILHPEGRANLLAALRKRRAQGALIVLDTNYRPRLWPDAKTAARVIGEAAAIAGLVLPSLDDMGACFDCPDPHHAMQLLQSLTPSEVVLTTGGEAVLYRAAAASHYDALPLPAKKAAKDTTGAGDSFNAAWMVCRDLGWSVEDAIAQAAALAGEVVCHAGAIIPKEAMVPLKSA